MMTALAEDEMYIMGKKQQWWQMRGDDSVAAACRRVTRCDGRLVLMVAAEGTMAADERGGAKAL